MLLRIVDVETDGLPPDARVVEIATVDLIAPDHGIPDQSGHGMDLVPGWCRGRMWSSLVNNGRPIPPEASAIHHITTEMVKDASHIEIAWQLASQQNADMQIDYFVAHNSRFERSIVPRFPELPWLCTYKAAVALWPDAPAHSNQALRYWLNLRLADDPGPPHRALGDAYVTAAIARRMLTTNDGGFLGWWKDISDKPALLPRFRFGKHAMTPIDGVPSDYLGWILKNITDDEDVLYTARTHLELRKHRAPERSPV